MAKRKMSTFERLQAGRMNRAERRELGRRVAASDPKLAIVNPDAGGIDVGNESHFVAVPPDRDENPVREFGCWTQALQQMAEWLKSCRIDTVAVQATGVYWIALYDVLEQHGIRVVLVNAQHTKNVPGRKTDVQECQWLGHERDGMVSLSWTRLTVTSAPVVSTPTDCCATLSACSRTWNTYARCGACGIGTSRTRDGPCSICRRR